MSYRYYTFQDAEGRFELMLDSDAFDAYRDTIESPRTGESCRAIPMPVGGKVKEGSPNKQVAHAGHIITGQKTLGSLAEKKSPDYVAEMEAKRKQQYHEAKRRRWEHFEKKMGTTLPEPKESTRKVDMSLNNMTKEETHRYIETGKKPIGLKERKCKPNE